MEDILASIEPLAKRDTLPNLEGYYRMRSLRPSERTMAESMSMLFHMLLWATARAHYRQEMVLIEEKPASEFFLDECGYINTTCALEGYGEDLAEMMATVLSLLIHYCGQSRQTAHQTLMERFKAKGLHGMHRGAKGTEKEPTEVCVVCMDAKRTHTYSEGCKHDPIMCSACARKVQQCPTCLVG